MRLLHVVPTYLPATRYGGPIHSVHGLCKALVRLGHEVHVYTSSLDGAGRSEVPENVPVDMDGVQVWYFRCRLVALCWLPEMSRALSRSIKGFDAVHVHSVFLWPMAKACSVARKFAIPYVISPRGMLVPELMAHRSALAKRIWIQLVERRNLRGACAIHVTSVQEGSDLERCGLSLAPLVNIPNGTEVPVATERNPPAGELLFLGRLSWKKNLTALIEAVARLPEATLTLAGPDDEGIAHTLLERARELGCDGRVRWVGEVGERGKTELFAQSACLVLPSLNENFGNVVVEALAHGCPVIVSPGVGARDVVKASGGGWVAPSPDADGLATCIRSFLDSGEIAAGRGAAGRQYVRRYLAWAAVAARMTGIYQAHVE